MPAVFNILTVQNESSPHIYLFISHLAARCGQETLQGELITAGEGKKQGNTGAVNASLGLEPQLWRTLNSESHYFPIVGLINMIQ